MRTVFSFLLLVALGGLLSSCEERVQPGEVARINGRVITLAQLEAMQSSAFLDWPASSAHEQNALRKQYGLALSDLLALELVKQQLEKKKLAVTDEDVQAEEALIRADYSAGAFEAMLLNEGIDLDIWRFLLKNRLSLQRFLEKVLRPDISLAPEEATNYYRQHEADFVRPPWAHFILISGADKDLLEQGKSKLAATGDPAQVQAQFPALVVRTVRMDMPRLLPVFVNEIAKMRPGQLSSVLKAEEEFHVLFLLESARERRLSPTEAYPLIEETLVEQKLNAAYNAWLGGRLNKAKIRVSRHLLPLSAVPSGGQEKKESVPAAANATVPAPVARGNGTASD